MTYSSTTSFEFLATVSAWIEQDGEVLAMIRYSDSAGSRDYELYQSDEVFKRRLLSLPRRTCVIVLRGQHLQLRGQVDEAFIQSALSAVEEGNEWLILSFQKTVAGSASWFSYSSGETLADLQSELHNYMGQTVAVGLHPAWLEDNSIVLSAVTPEPDGSVVTGVY